MPQCHRYTPLHDTLCVLCHVAQVHGALGKLLLAQAEANDGDGAQEAAEHLNQAAELASTAGKGKLAQQFFELAAQAESY